MTAFLRTTRVVLAGAVAALALAACGTVQSGGNTPAGGGPSGGAPSGGAPSGGTATTSPTPNPTMPSTGPGRQKGTAVTVDGVITQGVEPGCYVLTPTKGGQKYQVMVTGKKPPTDVPVTVHGTTQPGTMSYCQQGTPLQVDSVDQH